MQHVPVLLQEVMRALDPRPGDFMIDGTVDGGGHAAAVIQAIGPTGKFLGVDLDEAMLAECRKRVPVRAGVTLRVGNYADLPEIVAREGLARADGLLLDLGFSSEQLEHSGRGFSFSEASRNEPLLMTYDDARPPVRDLLERISERELADIIFQLGGERSSRRIARAIVTARRKQRIRTSGDLADIVRAALPKSYERGRIDPATRTFQALRIAANGELANLERILGSLGDLMAPGGRVAIITFHSLEDRTVKQSFRELARTGEWELMSKKPIPPSFGEIVQNPRSRSAKLRTLRKK
jgi:16S rRNA (cytosine1402-N4)-methyltransferase